MSAESWHATQSSKRYYVGLYRRLGTYLLVSAALNLVFVGVALYFFFSRIAATYYSTDGASPPTPLSALSAPNESSVPLLASDPDHDAHNEKKALPE